MYIIYITHACLSGLDKQSAREIRDFARADFERYRNERDLVKDRHGVDDIILMDGCIDFVGQDPILAVIWQTTNAFS